MMRPAVCLAALDDVAHHLLAPSDRAVQHNVTAARPVGVGRAKDAGRRR
jgi:hypothetical protein